MSLTAIQVSAHQRLSPPVSSAQRSMAQSEDEDDWGEDEEEGQQQQAHSLPPPPAAGPPSSPPAASPSPSSTIASAPVLVAAYPVMLIVKPSSSAPAAQAISGGVALLVDSSPSRPSFSLLLYDAGRRPLAVQLVHRDHVTQPSLLPLSLSLTAAEGTAITLQVSAATGRQQLR